MNLKIYSKFALSELQFLRQCGNAYDLKDTYEDTNIANYQK